MATRSQMPDHLRSKLNELISMAQTQKIVQAGKKIVELLKQAAIIYVVSLPQSLVGVHPKNKDGIGVTTEDVHVLLTKIIQAGWSDSQPDPFCVEYGPTHASVYMTFNQKLVDMSGGRLAPVSEAMKYLSIGASHCNQVLRAVECGVVHHGEDVDKITVDGKLNA